MTKKTVTKKAPAKKATKRKKPGRKPGKNYGKGQRTQLLYQMVLELVMRGYSNQKIAEELNISISYIGKIRHDDHFKAIFEEAIAARRTAINNRLEHLAETALDVHVEVMGDKAHRHRLQAAEGILDRIGATQKGSFVKQQVTQVVDNFAGRSQEDLEYYVEHGCFPEEAPE